jgi:rapamycin-insensitive companion of mTOR
VQLTDEKQIRQWGPTHPNPSTLTSPLGHHHPHPHASPSLATKPPLLTPTPTPSPATTEILKAVVKLGNTVLSNKAAADLNLLKSKKVAGLRSPVVFKQVLEVLSGHKYKLVACRFVFDLFDRGVLRKLVLDEEDEDEGEDEGDGEDSEGEEAIGRGRGFDGAFGGGTAVVG